jgi:hypothetical protein
VLQFPPLTRSADHPKASSTHYSASGSIIEVSHILSADDVRRCVGGVGGGGVGGRGVGGAGGGGVDVTSLASLRRILQLVVGYFWDLDPFDQIFREPVSCELRVTSYMS